MFNHPYQTTPCSAYRLDKIELEIKKELIEGAVAIPGSLLTDFKSTTHQSIKAVTAKHEAVPPFAHPLLVETDHGQHVVLDLRSCTKINRVGEFSVTSKSDFNFLMLRGAMQRVWSESGAKDVLNLGAFPLTVYIRWLSENIARRMSLDPAAQVIVTIVTGYFYLSLFNDPVEISENDKLKFASQISRATKIPADRCIAVIETLPPVETVHDYIDAMISAVQSVRLKGFNAGLLYSIIGGGWFGANAREVLAVAVEHPPTFISLVYSALNDRSYNRSLFAKTVLQADRNEAGKNFSYNLVRLPEL